MFLCFGLVLANHANSNSGGIRLAFPTLPIFLQRVRLMRLFMSLVGILSRERRHVHPSALTQCVPVATLSVGAVEEACHGASVLANIS